MDGYKAHRVALFARMENEALYEPAELLAVENQNLCTGEAEGGAGLEEW
jgi:hypothetical protein